jgi:hypothetical protein
MSIWSARVDWKTAAAFAAQQTLADRLRSTTTAWAAARHEYLLLREAQPLDVRALRKAAQRCHELGQLRRVLARDAETTPA